MFSRFQSITHLLLGAFAIAFVDLILKSVAVHVWSHDPVFFTKNYPIGLTYLANSGIAWGIPVPVGISLFLTAIVGGIGAFYFYDNPKTLQMPGVFPGVLCITGGALSNTFDRLTKGFVIDYVQVGAFPVFNLGDAAITIGTFLLILSFSSVWKTPPTHNGSGHAR